MPREVPPLSHFYRKRIPLVERGKGRFQLGDKVWWSPKYRTHRGTIVEVVAYGMWPTIHPKLHVRGYWRESESYVVEERSGKRYWPRVGNLRLLEE